METFIMLTVWTVVTMLVQLIEKKYNVSSRVVLLFFACLIALWYQIFTSFVPEAIQASAVQFVTWSLWTAVFVYEYLIRIIVKKQFPSADITEKE